MAVVTASAFRGFCCGGKLSPDFEEIFKLNLLTNSTILKAHLSEKTCVLKVVHLTLPVYRFRASVSVYVENLIAAMRLA